MSKIMVFAAIAAAAITAAAVPAALLIDNSENQLEQITKPKWPGKLIPKMTSARNIRDKHPEISCLTNHYGSNIIWNLAVVLEDTKFDDVHNFAVDSTSCLLVEYYKQEYEDGKWLGEFKLIWSVKNEHQKQGLITVTSARTVNGKLRGNSVAYTLKKNEIKWSAVRQKEVPESNKDAKGLSRLIPQASSKLPESPNKNPYWEFNPALENICGKGDCKKPKGEIVQKHYSWDFGGGGNDAIYSWTDNIDNWLKLIFGWEKIKNKMNIPKGKWQVTSDKPK